MKKFLLFCVLVFLTGSWAVDFVRSGRFERFLDTHPAPSRNAAIEYYWATLSSLAEHLPAAEYRFNRIREKYAGTQYAPLAWAELIELYDDAGQRDKVLDEGNGFLEKYPEHSKAELIRKKILLLQHGY